MTWTTAKPSKPGWYWWRRPKFKPQIVEVWEERPNRLVFETVRDQDDYAMPVSVAYDDTEWSSAPLELPKEQP